MLHTATKERSLIHQGFRILDKMDVAGSAYQSKLHAGLEQRFMVEARLRNLRQSPQLNRMGMNLMRYRLDCLERVSSIGNIDKSGKRSLVTFARGRGGLNLYSLTTGHRPRVTRETPANSKILWIASWQDQFFTDNLHSKTLENAYFTGFITLETNRFTVSFLNTGTSSNREINQRNNHTICVFSFFQSFSKRGLPFACPPTFGCGSSLAVLLIFRLSGFKLLSVSLSF